MLLFGLMFLFSPISVYFKGLSTIYALTNKRAIIITTWLRRSVQSYGSADIGAIERTDQPDGSGDLAFAKKMYRDGEGHRQETDVKFMASQTFARWRIYFGKYLIRVGNTNKQRQNKWLPPPAYNFDHISLPFARH
jgi:hypothetical protein